MIIKLKVSKKFNYQHNLVLFLLKDAEETRNLRTKRHNVEIMMGCKTGKILEQLFRSLLQNYQKDLEESMRGSEFNCRFIIVSSSKNKFKKRRIIHRFS